jgi:hypothetical protein
MTTYDFDRANQYFRDRMAFTTGVHELDLLIHSRKDPATYQVVDLRAPEHFAAGHAPGAINLPRGKWSNPKGLKKDATLYLYCYNQTCHLAPEAAVGRLLCDGRPSCWFNSFAAEYAADQFRVQVFRHLDDAAVANPEDVAIAIVIGLPALGLRLAPCLCDYEVALGHEVVDGGMDAPLELPEQRLDDLAQQCLLALETAGVPGAAHGGPCDTVIQQRHALPDIATIACLEEAPDDLLVSLEVHVVLPV